MINSAEGEALLQLSDVVTRTNLYKLKMAFRLELRKWVASCQISEQEEHETEESQLVFKIKLDKSVEGLSGALPYNDTGLA